MGDRGPEGAILGTNGIDVDPLVVAGGIGEQVDAVLVQRQPFARADHFPHQRLEVLEMLVNLHACYSPLCEKS
ncbi:hypothetical protein D3C81_1154190 [compost metagenome]